MTATIMSQAQIFGVTAGLGFSGTRSQESVRVRPCMAHDGSGVLSFVV